MSFVVFDCRSIKDTALLVIIIGGLSVTLQAGITGVFKLDSILAPWILIGDQEVLAGFFQTFHEPVRPRL